MSLLRYFDFSFLCLPHFELNFLSLFLENMPSISNNSEIYCNVLLYLTTFILRSHRTVQKLTKEKMENSINDEQLV